MTTTNVRCLSRGLGNLVVLVAEGERIIVTKHGKALFVLVSMKDLEWLERTRLQEEEWEAIQQTETTDKR